MDLPRLNFPQYSFRVSSEGGTLRVWDELRHGWLQLTREEWVRQHLLRFLQESGVPPAMIRQEHPVSVTGMAQRADIVVYGKSGRAALVVECKAPEVAIDQSVYAQAVRYNAVLGAPYVMLTNGLRHAVYRADDSGGYTPLASMPSINVMEM
jgi:type I site-specific restriction endonuclease